MLVKSPAGPQTLSAHSLQVTFLHVSTSRPNIQSTVCLKCWPMWCKSSDCREELKHNLFLFVFVNSLECFLLLKYRCGCDDFTVGYSVIALPGLYHLIFSSMETLRKPPSPFKMHPPLILCDMYCLVYFYHYICDRNHKNCTQLQSFLSSQE